MYKCTVSKSGIPYYFDKNGKRVSKASIPASELPECNGPANVKKSVVKPKTKSIKPSKITKAKSPTHVVPEKPQKIYCLTIFDKQTSESKNFRKGFMFPTKTLVARTLENLKKQFRAYITNPKNWLVPDDHKVSEIIDSIKSRNPHLDVAYITIYSESEI